MDDRLIEAVFKKEAIWNPDHKLYRNVPVLMKYWAEISKELGVNEKKIKNRWRNLRGYFIRELRLMSWKGNKGSPCKCEPRSGWVHFEKMRFLEKTLSPIEIGTESVLRSSKINKRSSAMEKSDDENDSSMHATEDVTVKEEPSSPGEDTIMYVISARDLHEATSTSNEEKMEESEKTEEDPQDDKTMKKNSDILFFESLLPFMAEIPMARKLQLRSKIQNLIESELEATKSQQPND